ncbi:hypothetical protein [Streptomyces zaomyceticus]|uniref:hypothetical protein n=1 Tax=Streptomyces zaomyceticus TaxID=68286 RepID=UPI0016742E22|nr:hypothetical protein [Streptomyces zaomyceticus]
MIESGTVARPTAAVPADRLVLRESGAGNRAAFVERFEEYGTEQWSGLRPSATPAGRGTAP